MVKSKKIQVHKGKSKAVPQVKSERCKACGLCISFCPQEALSFDVQINEKGFHPVRYSNQRECTGCAYCQLICPDLAITVVRKGKNPPAVESNLEN